MTNSQNELNNKITKTASQTFSRIGFALTALLLSSLLVQFAIVFISELIAGKDNAFLSSSWGMWLLSFAPMYFVAYPITLLILKKLPSTKPLGEDLSTKSFLSYFAIAVCLMYIGSYIGSFLSALLSNGQSVNSLNDYVSDPNPIKVIIMVIVGPLAEEYIFRKQLIDKTHIFGEKTAVLLSALIFGLVHTNMYQFFYAFLLGALFSYIYIRTGKIRYSLILHTFINFMGSVVAPYVLSKIDVEKINELANADLSAISVEEMNNIYSSLMPSMILSLSYTAVMGGLAFFGFFLLFRKSRQTIWKKTILELPENTSATTVYMSKGIISFITIASALTIASVFL